MRVDLEQLLTGEVVGVSWNEYYELSSVVLHYKDGRSVKLSASSFMPDQYSSAPMLSVKRVDERIEDGKVYDKNGDVIGEQG